MLVDIVSKNGNLLLNIPVRGDGSIDEKEEAILEGIAAWMDVNKQAIFGTRPWKVIGEGPATANTRANSRGPRFNEGRGMPLSAEDVRFTAGKDGSLYAIVLGWPEKALSIKSLGIKAADRKIATVELLGSSEVVRWKQTEDAMVIDAPHVQLKNDHAIVYKLGFDRT